jgi:hypothetical protein
LIKCLVDKTSERSSEFSLEYNRDYGEDLTYYIITEYIRRYMKERGISEENTFMELLYDQISENIEHITDPDFVILSFNLDEYLADYEISLEVYNGLLEALNSFMRR